MRVEVMGDQRVLVLAPDGAPVGAGNATDLIGEAWGHDVTVVAIPAQRLDPEFFRLSSGVAGELAQKLVNYHLQLAVVGDVSAHVAGSDALDAYVRESNRGRHVWFVADDAELAARLG
ncbi:DUF4180 domain-containing protein [Cellulomonas gilvus]|uniref:Alpha/beta hydrolase n=1 Tax=Cellulomonas gilvus (strain ATCC 13127 / NRRL B-14078) TaxID=593907 RepID=F8A7G3_CELGA|nr:DUF4180 domain-containing protein [Cellulomonas gilvus]AEI11221.1 alpha/beta hydrolase [Cellulomonas gilvus ATCC 13127]